MNQLERSENRTVVRKCRDLEKQKEESEGTGATYFTKKHKDMIVACKYANDLYKGEENKISISTVSSIRSNRPTRQTNISQK